MFGEVLKRKQWLASFIFTSILLFNLVLIVSRRRSSLVLVRETQCSSGCYIHVAFFGKYAFKKMKIVRGMARTYGSILEHTHSPVYLHVMLDRMSRNRVSRTLKKVARQFKRKTNVTFYDVEDMALENRESISVIRKYFFSKDVGKYDDDIFFLSEVLHTALPKRLQKLIFLDVDLEFQTDILQLHQKFEDFSEENVMGIAPDLQPQYRVDFTEFRIRNPGTPVGSPGFQGFNTGVVLFHLQKMRNSQLYNSLLNETILANLCSKYRFHGYLGHQDFYTLTGMEHPELYYKLDCSWNRQLDTGWKNEVERSIFDSYHNCTGKINVLHANGDAVFPHERII
ncbi:xyloside xylosyltransferase 1 [Parasteatoda tepidariorum]|uniref:xyloside xylosyltransferase 1 n=1 Tax=Parasteatoda tepidariorum TaxID=114398 RepID=UPI001C71FD30|nr:xyloside xylosyltransferase 1-like [Parasteatoda tepidariorum]